MLNRPLNNPVPLASPLNKSGGLNNGISKFQNRAQNKNPGNERPLKPAQVNPTTTNRTPFNLNQTERIVDEPNTVNSQRLGQPTPPTPHPANNGNTFSGATANNNFNPQLNSANANKSNPARQPNQYDNSGGGRFGFDPNGTSAPARPAPEGVTQPGIPVTPGYIIQNLNAPTQGVVPMPRVHRNSSNEFRTRSSNGQVLSANNSSPVITNAPQTGFNSSISANPEFRFHRDYESLLRDLGHCTDDDSEEWSQTRGKLQKKIEEHFDFKLKDRINAINELKQRLDSLQAQLDARLDSKDEIVNLKLQTMLNEVRGLGF